MSMTDEEVHAVWAKDQKQVKKLIDRDTACKVAMEVSITQVLLAEDAINYGMVVETISGVINTASFLAKDYLDECIQHLESDRILDREGLLGSLRRARDRVQMVSMANALKRLPGSAWWMHRPGQSTRGSGICICRRLRQCLASRIWARWRGLSLKFW